jgi:hypothetical protein
LVARLEHCKDGVPHFQNLGLTVFSNGREGDMCLADRRTLVVNEVFGDRLLRRSRCGQGSTGSTVGRTR